VGESVLVGVGVKVGVIVAVMDGAAVSVGHGEPVGMADTASEPLSPGGKISSACLHADSADAKLNINTSKR